VYVTAHDLQKSFTFNKLYKGIYAYTLCSKNMLYILSYGYYKVFKQQNWPTASLNVIGNSAIR